MTLINIADGTECRRRDEEVRLGENSKETVVGYRGGAGGEGGGGGGEGVLRVFIISPSQLDSVKL